MSFRELPYRVRQQIRKQLDRWHVGSSLKHKGHKVNTKDTKINILNISLCAPFNKIFEPSISIFGKQFDYSEQDIDWQKDIFSGKSFSLKFSKSLSIRSDQNLSAKNVWELNRLLFLPQIAANYAVTKNENYLRQFVAINESWINSNPYLLGINWYSNIEINIRLINWFVSWEIADIEKIELPWFQSFVKEKWIFCIYQHCLYSYHNPSLFSSANNHLIAEYAGLFIAASKWKFPESERWLDYAKKGLEQEIVKQHANGINREEAAEYIQFITDFLLIAYCVAEKTNNHFSEKYRQTLYKIFEYIWSFTDCQTNFPHYGDEDDGKAVLLSQDTHYNNFKSLLTSAAILFGDERFKSKSAGYDLKNRVLFGENGERIFSAIPDKRIVQGSSFYAQEGHFIFRKQTEEKEIFLHFDAAPLGYLSIAAHGHADALSFVLNINGIPVLIDSGTYSYHIAKQWRAYFVSTLAHNTVCVDGNNQARHVGDTLWHNHYKCKVLNISRDEELEIVRATHNGYQGVSHIREIIFDRKKNCFTLTDEIKISDKRQHTITMPYHIHPEIVLNPQTERVYTLTHQSGISVTVEPDHQMSVSLVCGGKEPIFGWYSSSFMQKCETRVLVSEIITDKDVKLVSTIIINEY